MHLSNEYNKLAQPIEKKKKAAIYARVSTVEQAEEGYSIDEQVRLLREFCKKEGYEVCGEYVDRGISGKNISGRPALQQLLSAAHNKEFDIVLVWKMNRFSRKSIDLLNIVEMLKSKNIGFRSYTEKYETESPSGKLQFQMMAAISEFERANISENVKMGMLARARAGYWNGGRVLGYDIDSTEVDDRNRAASKLIINEEEAQTVRKIFDLYTGGFGYKSIAGQLNRAGHQTKRKKSFSINSVKQILQNPLYVGIIRFNVRRDWNEKRRNNINPDPIMEKGKHVPLISQDTWDRTLAIMKSRGGRPNWIHSGEHPLTGIIRCPVCNSGMVLGRTTNKTKDGTKRILEYYVCGAWKNKGSTVCRSNGIRVNYADEYVLTKIATVANNERLIKSIVLKINSEREKNREPLQNDYKRLEKAIDSVQLRKDKILGLFEEGIVGKDDLIGRLATLNEEIEGLEERKAPIKSKMWQDDTIEVNFTLVKDVMNSFTKMFEESLTREQRKHLLHLLINKITISESREIDSIKIQLNKEVVKHFTTPEGERSSDDDDLSPSFTVFMEL